MKKEINFPLIFGDKVYYNIEEIPEDIKRILEASSNSEFVENSSTKKWEINGVVYTNQNDIPEEFRYLIEDKNNNGVPDLFESVIDGPLDISKMNSVKKTNIQAYQFDNKINPHKSKFAKESENKDHKFIIIVLMFLIILALLGYIIFRQ